MDTQWSLLKLFEMGGPFMWPLAVFSVATIALIIERVSYILFHDLKVVSLKKEVMEHVGRGRLDQAKTYLSGQKPRKIGAKVLLELVRHADMGENGMEKAVEAEAQDKIRRLENGFNFLTALASISPLTGFLGTVSGMIGAFRSIATADEVNAQLVANGIYEALITTVFGLIIAIIALTGYNLLAHRVDNFSADIAKASSDIISAVSFKQRETGT